MANISPGVYTKETDVSAYVRELGTTQVAMIGTTVTGPTTPTYITSTKDFTEIFGPLHPDHYLPYAAMAYLNQGNGLWVTRVTPADSRVAKLAVAVPKNLTQYTANWALTSYDSVSNTAVFTVSNDDNKMVDPTGLANEDLWIGAPETPTKQTFGMGLRAISDIRDENGGSALANRKITFTAGPGRGTTAGVFPLDPATQPATSDLLISVDMSKFDPSNSPITYVAKAFITPTKCDITAAVDGNLGKFTNEETSGYLGSRLFADVATAATAVADVTSTTEATKLAALEAFTTTGGKGIKLVMIGTAADAILDAAKSATVVNAFLTYFRTATTAPAVGTYPNLNALYGKYRAIIGGTFVGLGLASGTGISKVEVDTLGRLVLTSILAGPAGIVKINWIGGGTATWTINGTCEFDMFRPEFMHEAVGTGKVPVFLKLSGKGATDLSNIAPAFGMLPGDVTSKGEQNYTLRIFRRIVADTVDSKSMNPADFELVEQFTGPLTVIRSQINASSTLLSASIDYSVDTTFVQATGKITKTGEDNLILSPYFLLASLGKVALCNFTSIAGKNSIISGMYGGASGSPIKAFDIIGDPGKGTGIYSYSNPEAIDINIILAPGWSADPAVARTLTEVCISRSDCMTVLDTPFGLTPQEVVDYRKKGQNINSNYAALYYPWIKIADGVNRREVFVPPSGHVVAQYAYNDRVADVNYAPAGRTRGQITAAISTERVLTQGDRDLLCANNVNPVHNEAGNGVYIKGQYTLQTQSTALDRVNVRRLMLQLRKTAALASRVFEFEPLDATTSRRVRVLLEGILEDRLRRGHISYYTLDMGPTVNTTNSLDNSTLNVKISVVPNKAVEILVEEYMILGQGAGAMVLE